MKKYLAGKNHTGFKAALSLVLLFISVSMFCQPRFEIKTGIPEPVMNNQGDTWIAAYSIGDTIYTPSDDTKGFYELSQTFYSNIAFNKLIISSCYPHVKGITVNKMTDYGKGGQSDSDGCTWKSSGCYAIDDVIYWVVARHKYGDFSGDAGKRQLAYNASIIKSYDHGATWSRKERDNYTNPMFPGNRFSTPYFVQYGLNGSVPVDNADKYVYAVSNNGFWDNGDNLILGRVVRGKIEDLNPADWQFYTGGNGMEDMNWSYDMNKAKYIIDNPGKLGMSGVVYNQPLKKYFYIGWYYPDGGGKLPGASQRTVWDFYESDKPWGPWIKFDSCQFEPQGYYTPQICPVLISSDGKKLTVFTAGDWNNDLFYRLTLVPVEIIRR